MLEYGSSFRECFCLGCNCKIINYNTFQNLVCSGTANIANVNIACDGSCLPDGNNAGMYFTCLYINLPATTTFAFTSFTDNVCTKRGLLPVGLYKGDNLCWWTGGTTSIVPLTWDGVKVLTVFSYGKSDKCYGSTAVTVAGPIQCDGSCQKDAWGQTWYTCIAISMPTTGTFTFSSYTDNTCKTVGATPGKYSGANLCWNTGASSSVVPTTWTPATSTLNLWAFSNSRSCAGDLIGVQNYNIPCNGSTCLQNQAKTTEYFTCQYSLKSGRYQLVGLITIALALLALF